MGRHQADEADGANEADGAGGQQGDDGEDAQTQAPHVDAQGRRPRVAEPQGGQLPHHRRQRRHPQRQDAGADRQVVPGRLEQRAEQPKHNRPQHLRRGQILHQGLRRLEQEQGGDTGQDHGLGGHRPQARQAVNQQRRQRGSGERGDRHRQPRQPGQRHPQQQGQCRAKPGGGRKPQGVGAGQGIAQQGLHRRAGDRQGGAHNHRHQGHWQANVPDNRHHPGIGAGRRRPSP